MAQPPYHFEEPKSGWKSYALYAVLGVLLLGFAYFLYLQLTGVRSVKVDAPSATVVNMLPPPPPPPPPPPKPVEKPPEPTDKPTPAPPSPAPTPDKAAPAPMTIAGPATAGADSYGMQAGSGGGMGGSGSTGTCLAPPCGTGGGGPKLANAGFYLSNIRNRLQHYVDRDGRVNTKTFDADFLITISSNGSISLAEMTKTTEKPDIDNRLKEILESVHDLGAPPAQLKFPLKINVKGRRT